MEYLIIALQVIVGVSILNVWLVQNKKATQWRGGNATTLVEEFEVYGLPGWSLYFIGFLKVTLSILLIAGIWYPSIISTAAIGLAMLLGGSVAMHLKVRDPLIKSFPAALFLLMCLIIAYYSYPM